MKEIENSSEIKKLSVSKSSLQKFDFEKNSIKKSVKKSVEKTNGFMDFFDEIENSKKIKYNIKDEENQSKRSTKKTSPAFLEEKNSFLNQNLMENTNKGLFEFKSNPKINILEMEKTINIKKNLNEKKKPKDFNILNTKLDKEKIFEDNKIIEISKISNKNDKLLNQIKEKKVENKNLNFVHSKIFQSEKKKKIEFGPKTIDNEKKISIINVSKKIKKKSPQKNSTNILSSNLKKVKKVEIIINKTMEKKTETNQKIFVKKDIKFDNKNLVESAKKFKHNVFVQKFQELNKKKSYFSKIEKNLNNKKEKPKFLTPKKSNLNDKKMNFSERKMKFSLTEKKIFPQNRFQNFKSPKKNTNNSKIETNEEKLSKSYNLRSFSSKKSIINYSKIHLNNYYSKKYLSNYDPKKSALDKSNINIEEKKNGFCTPKKMNVENLKKIEFDEKNYNLRSKLHLKTEEKIRNEEKISTEKRLITSSEKEKKSEVLIEKLNECSICISNFSKLKYFIHLRIFFISKIFFS